MSRDLDSRLVHIDSQLRSFSDAEATAGQDLERGHPTTSTESGAADEVAVPDNARTKGEDPARIFTESASTSGLCTPYEKDSSSNNSSGSDGQQEQELELMRRMSSVVQIGKEQTIKWNEFPRKGYKVTTKFFYQEIDSSWTATMIVACFFVSGLVDSLAYGIWSTFVNMQTGNTIILALRISSQPSSHQPLSYLKSLVSLASYCLGALFFNCLHRAPTGLSNPNAPLHRWTLLTSFTTQSLLLITVALLAQTGVISNEEFINCSFSSGTTTRPGNNYKDLLGIGLLAFEAAGSVSLSRALFINELPTMVLSTLYHDLIGESLGICRSWRESTSRWDFAVRQKKQIRRMASILALFGGALLGGFVFQSKWGLPGALWIAAGCKIMICVGWCCWKKKIVTETVVTKEKGSPPAATTKPEQQGPW